MIFFSTRKYSTVIFTVVLRKINIDGMSRDYKTKMKYFEAEPEELKRRYAAIGVHNYEYKCKFLLFS